MRVEGKQLLSRTEGLEKLVQELMRKLDSERRFNKQLESLCEAKDALLQASQAQLGHLGSLATTLQGVSQHEEEARRLGQELHKSRGRLAKAKKRCLQLGIDD